MLCWGLALLTPRIHKVLCERMGARGAARYLAGLVAASLGAQAGTLPLVALHFSWLAPAAVLLNCFYVPLTALVVALGGAALTYEWVMRTWWDEPGGHGTRGTVL